MNEPLKKKILLCDLCADCRLAPKQDSYVFEKEDVQSAVKWLKEKMNEADFTIFQDDEWSGNEVFDSFETTRKHWLELIDEAFSDVIEKREEENE